MLAEIVKKYPQADDIVVRKGELHVIESKRLVAKEREEGLYEFFERKFVSDKDILDLDTSYVEEGYRFRVNVSKAMHGYEFTFRYLKDVRFQLEGVSRKVADLLVERVRDKKGGILLVIGPTGSGKSTLMANILSYILGIYPARVITVEDPIEYPIAEGIGSVVQRQVGIDTESFARGLKSALRQNPNIIFVGEVRDEETVRLLLQAGETGHVVVATLHTDRASDTFERLLNLLPPSEQELAKSLLARNCIGVLGTRLYSINGKRAGVQEFLNVAGDSAIQGIIRKGAFTHLESYRVVEKGHIPLEMEWARLIREGKLSESELPEGVDRVQVKRFLMMRGFSLVELLVALVVLSLLSVAFISLGSSLADYMGDIFSRRQAQELKEKIEKFYEEYPSVVNTNGVVRLPNGCELGLNGGAFIPLSQVRVQTGACGPGGLYYFDSRVYDYKNSNLRVLVSPLLFNGRYRYRHIYLVYTKGARRGVFSRVNPDGSIFCHPQEECYQVNGEEITGKVYQRAEDLVNYVAGTLQNYAFSRYTADATKNPLVYRLAGANSGGGNNRNCTNPECYYDAGSVIAPSCGRVGTGLIRTTDGKRQIVLPFSVRNVLGSNPYASVNVLAPSLFTQDYNVIYLSNCSVIRNSLPRVPENVDVANFGGWNAVVFACISEEDCIVRIVNQ